MFLFYIATLSAVLAMSTACLTATESGFFSFQQEVRVGGLLQDNSPEDISVDYEVRKGRNALKGAQEVTDGTSPAFREEAPWVLLFYTWNRRVG